MPHSAFLLFSPLLKSTMISNTTLQKKQITARRVQPSLRIPTSSAQSPSELHGHTSVRGRWDTTAPREQSSPMWWGLTNTRQLQTSPIHQGSLHQSSSPNHQAACLQRTGPQPVPSMTFSQCCGTVGGFPQSLGLSPSFFQCFSEVMKIINAYYAEALLHCCSFLLHLPKAMSSLQNREAGTMLSHR